MFRYGFYVLLLVTLHVSTEFANGVDWDVWTALDEYVNSPDPHYDWKELERYEGPGYTVHVLNMTSQKWMDETVVQEPVWWHYLNIFVPHTPRIRDSAYLLVTGGGNNDGTPDMNNPRMRRLGDMCRNVGVVSAFLGLVPNQPQFFLSNRSLARSEDMIIAHTWKLFIEAQGEPDPNIVVLLPMTKAGKLAVDTIRDFVAAEYTDYDIQKYMPYGVSKRGWVAWLLGCVDKRVFAIAPSVFDLLNLQDNLEHHYRSLGGWSWAFAPYWIEDVSRYLYHPRFKDLETVMDPFYFNERLTMPKMIIVATGDQFFLPDGSHYFFDRLSEPKFMQLWENDDHDLSTHIEKISEYLQAFFLASYQGQLPRISWTRGNTESGGRITVQTSQSVISVAAWSADTTNITCELAIRNATCRRDFRSQTTRGRTDIVWYKTDVTQIGIDQFMAEFDDRDDFGFRGFFIEMTLPGPSPYHFRFTTELHITPDVFPYPKCQTEQQCRGLLV